MIHYKYFILYILSFLFLIMISGKLVVMGSDGASNMVGKRSGLAILLQQDINDEIINMHCFAHRLELAFRDVLKKNKSCMTN